MTSTDAKIQLNWNDRSPIPLINIYASSTEEADYYVAYVQGNIATWVATGQDLIAAGAVGAAGALAPGSLQPPAQPAAAPPAAPNVWQAAPAAPPAAFAAAVPAPAGQTCQHGARTYKEGQGNNGPWKGWFCPTPKGAPDKCKTVYV